MFNLKMITVIPTKRWSFKVANYWMIVLCGWLLILSGAGAAIDRAQPDRAIQVLYPTPTETVWILKSHGFAFIHQDKKIEVIPYDHKTSTTLSNPNETIPSYTIECTGSDLSFTIPSYSDAKTARAALYGLRRIASIRTSIFYLSYLTANSKCHQENMQIISRVINLVECKALCLHLNSKLGKSENVGRLDLELCEIEAQSTFNHVIYDEPCQFSLSSQMNDRLPDLRYFGIILLRPITSVVLTAYGLQNTHMLNNLRLVNGYTLTINGISKTAYIDLSALQPPSSKCNQITISVVRDAKVEITGLENAVANHPEIALKAPWATLQHLGEQNATTIKVYNILGLDATQDFIQLMLNSPQPKSPSKTQVTATIATVEVDPTMPCNALDVYNQVYNPETYAKYGIRVERVHINYKNGRTDLYETIDTLYQLGALPASIKEKVKQSGVVCCGSKISLDDWKLTGQLNIPLYHPQLSGHLRQYKACHVCFCQNIHYPILNINGDKTPRKRQAKLCHNLLDLFRSITATELKISNTREDRQPNRDFDLNTLKKELGKKPKYLLNVAKLTLDNVDMSIIYRMLGRYVFEKPTEVHILNQTFSNLAIAQVLGMLESQNIAFIVINDFHKLNEVRHYNQQDQIEGFSLLSYVKEQSREGKTVKDLHLDKLFLQTGETDFSLDDEVLVGLLSYGIKISTTSCGAYLKALAMYDSQYSLSFTDAITIYNTTLAALQSDLVSLRSQQSPVQRASVMVLRLHFGDGQALAEEDLVTVVRWVALRFKDVWTLRISNVKIAHNMQLIADTRHYLIRDLERLKSIQLEDTNSYSPPVEVLANVYQIGSLTNANSPELAVIAMPHSVLSQLATHDDEQLDQLIPAPQPNGSTTSLQKIAKHIKENRHTMLCSVCLDTLYIPTRPKANAEENGEEPALKKACRVFNPKEHFTTFCYRKCGHPHCGKCLIRAPPDDKCPNCRNTSDFDGIDWLISVPPANLIFAQDSTNLPSADPNWRDKMDCLDGQVYLYVSYRRPRRLAAMLNDNIANQPPNRIYII
ncbi:hypothetical protein NEHOM01_0652 [Nematocida homosporus]|uniref:uncharacterized protein n=1 Tax=Nematocida homosporus TaxID=1912981 RepID=UPI00221EAEB7|nr:uncharacterized protein NEHOM01_0652 [Nematocida homosporus]KAI5185147.1 hypothetical protein NEHOM01_0652 [Nematocida homosporus]